MSYDNRSFSLLKRFVAEQEGATSAEYACIMAIVIIAAVTSLAMFGSNLSGSTSAFSNELSGAGLGPGSFGPGTFRTQSNVALP